MTYVTIISTGYSLLFIEDRAERYVSPEERQRQERLAVARICRCGDCRCCLELKESKQ